MTTLTADHINTINQLTDTQWSTLTNLCKKNKFEVTFDPNLTPPARFDQFKDEETNQYYIPKQITDFIPHIIDSEELTPILINFIFGKYQDLWIRCLKHNLTVQDLNEILTGFLNKSKEKKTTYKVYIKHKDCIKHKDYIAEQLNKKITGELPQDIQTELDKIKA